MRVAVIDMGTNTFHLLLAELKDDDFHIFLTDRKAVKVGESITENRITEEAWGRAIDVLKAYKAMTKLHKVDRIYATATSVVRNAVNGQALVEEIIREIGIEVEIISGEREAELIFRGASRALKLGNKKSVIVDIGGGSVEFIIADSNKVYWLKSFEIGGQRLVAHFHKSDPISEAEIDALNAFFREQLVELVAACEKYQPQTLIGCSGAFETLSNIYDVENAILREATATEYTFPITAFRNILSNLTSKTRAERLAIPGMIEMRVDMIVVASILIDFLIKTMSIKKIRVSAYALKEGILYSILER